MHEIDPHWLIEFLIEFLIGLPIACCEWCILEWWIHRNIMHRQQPGFLRRWWVAHAKAHHGRWSKTCLTELSSGGPGAYHDEKDPSYGFLKSSPAWLLCGFLWSWPLALSFALVGWLQGVGWRAAHRQFHSPTGVWWARGRLFRALERHHGEHHREPTKNFGVLFGSCADTVFGTRS